MDDKVNGKVKGNDDSALNRNIDIISRMKEVIGATTNADIARYANLKAQNVAAWKNQGVPDKWIVKISKEFGVSVNYILYGNDDVTYRTETPGHHNMKETSGEYGPNKFGEMNEEEWEILGKAYKIITSQSAYKSPLVQCINAFYEALSGRQEIENLKMRIQVLEKVKNTTGSKGLEEEDSTRSAI